MTAVEGKVAVVTGAGQGIGRAVALEMARHGAKVVVNDIGASLDGQTGAGRPAEDVVAEIRAAGGEAVASFDSVSDWDSAHRIIDTALDAFGAIDIVVNNAGILRDSMFHKMDKDQWQAVIDVHLGGSFFVSRAAAARFRAQESGSFVHMTSTAGLFGNLGQANYASAKMGITALSRVIALEMGRYNVRSNCIAPSAATRMTESVPVAPGQEAARAARLAAMPAKSVATLAVYLASDAASEVSGQVFGARGNEVYLFSQPSLVRTLHNAHEWSPESMAVAIPSLKNQFEPLVRIRDVFPWDPM
ncbi:MAG: SDR family NAD(P)-dependent oxidoreductase [Sphingomonadales bacterium]|nr:MAG: SDR family NAD(P)-dependent oxidoreductase [Sphingomonadales bacterium]